MGYLVKTLSEVYNAALDAIYPPTCGCCGRGSATPICEWCMVDFIPCFIPFSRFIPPGALTFRASPYEYQARALQAVQRLKYARNTSLARPMAELLAAFVVDQGLHNFDAILPVPIHYTRRAARGFNQSELLSEAMDRQRVKPHLLTRTRATLPQASLSPEKRAINLLGAFRASPEVVGQRILMVDDVFTSGHTAYECAQTLRKAGATEVGIVTFCRAEGAGQ